MKVLDVAHISMKMCYLGWHFSWKRTQILKDIKYLALKPVALSIYLWSNVLLCKTVILNSDNQSVVSILNSCTPKSQRVMSLIRYIFLFCHNLAIFILKHDIFLVYKNLIADSISCQNFQKFRVRTSGRNASHSSTNGILEHSRPDVQQLIGESNAISTWNTHKCGIQSSDSVVMKSDVTINSNFQKNVCHYSFLQNISSVTLITDSVATFIPFNQNEITY